LKKYLITIAILLIAVPCFGLEKNIASQHWGIFCFDETDNTAKTGDAANITASVRIDGAAADTLDAGNPTELASGYYDYTLTQGETNGDYIILIPVSVTGDVQCIGCPPGIYTVAPNFSDLTITSGAVAPAFDNIVGTLDDAEVANDVQVDVVTVETADATNTIRDSVVDDATRIDASSVNAVEAKVDTVDGIVDSILLYTDGDGANGIDADIDDIKTDTAAYDTDAEHATAVWTGYNLIERSTAPPYTPTPAEALMNLHQMAVFKTETTASESRVYTSGGGAAAYEHDISDDGTTFTKGRARTTN
jgi:hypothetical protein